MNDEPLLDALRERSERGDQRGDETVWTAASHDAQVHLVDSVVASDLEDVVIGEPHPERGSRTPWYLAAAAAITVLVIGVGVLLSVTRTGETPVAAGDVEATPALTDDDAPPTVDPDDDVDPDVDDASLPPFTPRPRGHVHNRDDSRR